MAPGHARDRPNVVFVLGGPGVGKGTNCARISSEYGYHHLSAGDLLRDEQARPGSEQGELIKNFVKEGRLVPVEITIKLIEQAMRALGWEGGNFLIDGFPRSFDNLRGWDSVLGGSVNIKFCLFFDCAETVMESRLIDRGRTSGRADDNPETIKKRFRTFQQESLPVVQKLEADGMLRRVNSQGPKEEVWAQVRELFRPRVVFVLGGPGSGKGTQCSRIQKQFGYNHLSAGDLLREEKAKPDSEHGRLINDYIREGKLVPVEITVKLIESAMKSVGWEGGRFLIDGFPRSLENLRGWDSVIGNTVDVEFVLFFDCSEATMEARLLQRGLTSGRADDNAEAIKKRFKTFNDESMPVVKQYERQGLLRQVRSEATAEQVWERVKDHFHGRAAFQQISTWAQRSPQAVSERTALPMPIRMPLTARGGGRQKREEFSQWETTYSKHYQEYPERRFLHAGNGLWQCHGFKGTQTSQGLAPPGQLQKRLQLAGSSVVGGGGGAVSLSARTPRT